MQRKLRTIKTKQINAPKVYGITIPPELGEIYKEVYFTITQQGNNILLISGTQIRKVSTEGYNLHDFET